MIISVADIAVLVVAEGIAAIISSRLVHQRCNLLIWESATHLLLGIAEPEIEDIARLTSSAVDVFEVMMGLTAMTASIGTANAFQTSELIDGNVGQ